MLATKIKIASENSLIIYVGEQRFAAIGQQQIQYIGELTTRIEQSLTPILIDVTPSYASVLVTYDALKTDHYHVRRALLDTIGQVAGDKSLSGRLVELPVYYGEEVASDLENVSKLTQLSIEDIIDLHSKTEYQVWAMGFAPGFGYLGQLPESLQLPRKDSPSQRVPAGSVAIAEAQTAIYPNPFFGGWYIIGNCPLSLFNTTETPPTRYQVGDRVRFRVIDKQEFVRLGGSLS
jgi:KipI family sensor histidine kinase inhibitor